MNSNKVTAIATSVIAISLLGFIFNSTYNSRENIVKRCVAKYQRRIEKGAGVTSARTKYLLSECLK